MAHINFTKNLLILIIAIAAFILLIAEGETWRMTILIKTIACALIGCDLLLYNEWKEDLNK